MYGYKVPLKQKDTTRPCGILSWNNIHTSAPGHFVRNLSKQQLRICLSFLFLLPFLFIIQMNLPLAFISLQHIQRDNTSPVIFIVMPHYILFFLFIFNVWWYMMVLTVSELLRVHFHQRHKLLMGYDEKNFYMAQEKKKLFPLYLRIIDCIVIFVCLLISRVV